jgi:glycosyltransferase involved in cell wall biosynthesis
MVNVPRRAEANFMNPLVSVVMPAFNAERYIAESVDSVLSQTFQDFEIIIVDDGSTDKTIEIVGKYGSRVKVISQENSGPSRARNTGIMSAAGRYIAFLDSDDLWTEDKLEVQVGFMESNPRIDMVVADMMMFQEDATIFDSYFDSIRIKGFYDTLISEQRELQDAFSMLLQCNFIPTGTVLLRKECLEKSGLFDEKISTVEDLDLWIRISIFSKIGVIPKVLKKKRSHMENISKDIPRARSSYIYVLEKIQRDFPQMGDRYRMAFDKKLSSLYCNQGYYYFSINRMKESRFHFYKSLSLRINGRAFTYGLASFIPLTALMSLRKIKWKTFGGVN